MLIPYHVWILFFDDNEETKALVNQCYQKKRTTINPIIDWEDEDVWEFLNDVVKVPHCSLYDEGFTRLGCVGCPLQGREGMLRDFERWPQYKNLYIKAFEKMIANHPGEIKVATGELAEANGGGYSDIHRLAPLVHLTENQSLTSGEPNQMKQAPKALPHTHRAPRTGQQRDDSGYGSTTDEAPRERERRGECFSAGGCGCTEVRKTGTNRVRTDTSQQLGIPIREIAGDSWDDAGLLAVALPERPSGRVRAKTRAFNPDPKVADYVDAYEILEIFLDT